MAKQSSVNQIEITSGGSVQFRIALDVVDGSSVESRKWHRSALPPGSDIDAQMSAVNANLQAMGWPPVTDYQAIKDHAAVAWTPEVIAAFKAAQDG